MTVLDPRSVKCDFCLAVITIDCEEDIPKYFITKQKQHICISCARLIGKVLKVHDEKPALLTVQCHICQKKMDFSDKIFISSHFYTLNNGQQVCNSCATEIARIHNNREHPIQGSST